MDYHGEVNSGVLVVKNPSVPQAVLQSEPRAYTEKLEQETAESVFRKFRHSAHWRVCFLPFSFGSYCYTSKKGGWLKYDWCKSTVFHATCAALSENKVQVLGSAINNVSACLKRRGKS